MVIKKIFFLIIFCLFITSCSTGRSDEIQQASGKRESATQLGVRYLLGRGVQQDDQKAFQYFKQAASEDDPFAENELAYMYAAGKGTTRDYGQAFKYYQEAADHGLAS